MKKFDTLYARNSNGKINEWKVVAQQMSDACIVIISEGLINGEKTATSRTCKGKNIGKMNETSPYEQACLDAQSRWEKKKKQGYKSLMDLDIIFIEQLQLYQNCLFQRGVDIQYILEWTLPKNRTDANNFSKPMKASSYFKDNGEVRIKFPAFGQPKLNGFRVMARWEEIEEGEGIFKTKVEKVVFRSKEGLRYDILEHIEKEFTKNMFLSKYRIKDNNWKEYELVFDGEMYIHGEVLSEISSAVRKKNSNTHKIKFYIFDIAIEELCQSARLTILEDILTNTIKSNIELVPTINIKSNEHAQISTDQWIKEGFEGGIFRDIKATYQFGKRPQTIVKLKRSQDKEFKILDVVGGDNSPDLGIFLCQAENGLSFKCTPEGSHDIKREYLIMKVRKL